MKYLSLAVMAAVALAPIPATAADTACSGWTQVSSPNIGVSDNVLASVAANSASDIWAVGLLAPDNNPNKTQTLIQHYDGTAWSVVTSPNEGSKANALLSVTANSGLAWAVGYYIDPNHVTHSLIEAWDGSAWNIIDHPKPGSTDLLFGVWAVSPGDIWAVGVHQEGDSPMQTLIEHFDGTSWSISPSPSPGTTGNQLYAVHGTSARGVWAVGQSFGGQGPDTGLIEHWDGSQWSVVTSARDGNSSELFYAIGGDLDANLWAAGDAQNGQRPPQNLIERHTGAWLLESVRSIGAGENHFYGIATTGDVVYAVGTYGPMANSNNLQTLIERRGTGGWVQESSPNPGKANGNSELGGGVVVVSPTDVWAVGTYDGVTAAQTLILHRCQ